DVPFITAVRAVLGLPKLAGVWVVSQPFGASNTRAPDFRKHAWLADERIVGGRGAVGGDVNDIPKVRIHLLRYSPGIDAVVISIPDRDEQIALGIDSDAAPRLPPQ